MTIPNLVRSRWAGTFVYIVAAILTLSYYNWLARASGDGYPWGQDLAQFYCYLGRAFAQGQLYLPVEPSKELLALKDPWDPALNFEFKLHDAVLYKDRYYLYHGAGPAVVLFAPWRMLTGHDLPSNFAAMLLCFLGYLFLSGSLILLLKEANATPKPGLLMLMLLVLGMGTGVPYLLNRVDIYEVAIAAAYFGAAGGLFFLICGLSRGSTVWFALSGFLVAIALASRPHVGIAVGVCTLSVVIWGKRWRGAFALGLPIVVIGLAVLAYNYARFDDPFEFGLRYLLAGQRNQQRLNMSTANLYPGAYYMLFCSPLVSPVFPFVHVFIRPPFLAESLPQDYFFEPTAGALLISPVLAAVVLLPVLRRSSSAAAIVLAALGTAALAFLFVIATGFTTQRYQTDFVPLLLVAALVCLGVALVRWSGRRRMWLIGGSLVLCLWTVFANAALGITGPYDDILQQRPVRWIRVARWFSFSDRQKPLLNPPVAITAQVRFKKHGPGLQEPLFVLGYDAHRWALYAEHTPNGVLLTSASRSGTVKPERLLQPDRDFQIRAAYDTDKKIMSTVVDGEPLIRQQLEGLVLAPSQAQLARNHNIPFFTYPEFTGAMNVIECRIGPNMSTR